MKKLLSVLLITVLAVALLTGCGSDPVYDDIYNYLNVEMTEVNENYTKITTEVGKWETITDDADLKKSIEETLLPLVNESLEKLKEINPSTEEIKAIKEKYVKVMENYKAGFEALAKGCETQSDETINEGTQKLEEALKVLDDYNKSLEEVASKHGAEIEY